MMRFLQAFSISVPAWIFLFLLIVEGEVYLDEWEGMFITLTIALAAMSASVLAFLGCDLRVVLGRGDADTAPKGGKSSGNMACWLTGLALGLYRSKRGPAFIRSPEGDRK